MNGNVSDLSFEKVCIQKAQAGVEAMRQNLEGLDTLNRVHARLQEEIADICAAMETVARLRTELWAKQQQEFDRTQAMSEVVGKI